MIDKPVGNYSCQNPSLEFFLFWTKTPYTIMTINTKIVKSKLAQKFVHYIFGLGAEKYTI